MESRNNNQLFKSFPVQIRGDSNLLDAASLNATNPGKSYSVRDVIAMLFRHKRIALLCFSAVILAGSLAALLLPKYTANMKLLVKRERIDPVVTAEQAASPVQIANPVITEEELNSEVELLTSEDLLRKVVMANQLQKSAGTPLFGPRSEEARIARAVRRLRSNLVVAAVHKANIINVSYSNHNPELAARVLGSLANFYMEKHTAVHRPIGQFAFFEQQTEESRKKLQEAEARLRDFSRQQAVVAPQIERDNTLQKLSEMNFNLQQTKAAVRETQNRIEALQKLAASTPDRITTQLRKSDNPQLMQQLKSTLLTLQLKRTELLTKYQPTYRLVQEVDKQIAETQTAIDAENARPLQDETTDQNPTHEWVRAELAKARADLSSFEARAAALQSAVNNYQSGAHQLEEKQIVQQDLVRNAKAEEDKYLLYLRKREEARITDALDQRRILNVALAEEPATPSLPSRSGLMYLGLGTLMAIFAAIAAIFVSEYIDDSFRTPDELRMLNVPVIAAIPFRRESRLLPGWAEDNTSLEVA